MRIVSQGCDLTIFNADVMPCHLHSFASSAATIAYTSEISAVVTIRGIDPTEGSDWFFNAFREFYTLVHIYNHIYNIPGSWRLFFSLNNHLNRSQIVHRFQSFSLVVIFKIHRIQMMTWRSIEQLPGHGSHRLRLSDQVWHHRLPVPRQKSSTCSVATSVGTWQKFEFRLIFERQNLLFLWSTQLKLVSTWGSTLKYWHLIQNGSTKYHAGATKSLRLGGLPGAVWLWNDLDLLHLLRFVEHLFPCLSNVGSPDQNMC